MTSKKQLRADIQALRDEAFIREQEIELMTAERDMLQAQVDAARRVIAQKDADIRTLSGLIHYQGDGEADEAMKVVAAPKAGIV